MPRPSNLRARSPPVIRPETIPMFCNNLSMHDSLSRTSVLATEVFTISGDQLRALKRHCGGASTFCVVSALVWWCVCVSVSPVTWTRMTPRA
jgi:shikimate O-hydroxycinnamoyltransferase